MRIQAKNYRGLLAADVAVSRIALVGGKNGQGKSSLFQAIQSALSSNGVVAGVLKKDAAVLVHENAKSGFCSVTDDAGAFSQMEWPKCKPGLGGDGGAPWASNIALAVDSPLGWGDVGAALRKVLPSDPTDEDIQAAITAAGYSDGAVAKIAASIKADGWDATLSKVKENITKTKGAWEAATGEKYGPKKAEDWGRDAEGDVDALEAEADAAQSALNALEGKAAYSGEKLADLERLADEYASAPFGDDGGAAIEAAQVALDDAIERRNAIVLPDADNRASCPECGAVLNVSKGWKTGEFTLNAIEEIDVGDLKARRKEKAGLDGEVSNLDARLNTLKADKIKADAAVDAQASRLAEIEKIKAAGCEDHGPALAAARERATEAKAAAGAAALANAAKGHHAAIAKATGLAEALAPDGLRLAALVRALKPFNERLAELAKAAGWDPLRIGSDMTSQIGSRPFALACESEQWRGRVLFQVAVAEMDKSCLVLIDRADILDTTGRNGLFQMLMNATDLRAVVFMTQNKPDAVPCLTAAGVGASYWIDGGNVRPLHGAKKEAA